MIELGGFEIVVILGGIVGMHGLLKRNCNAPIVAATAANLIPEKLYKYRNCLDAEQASKLPLKNSRKHIINLTPGVEPLYGPLYNLSRKKLKVL